MAALPNARRLLSIVIPAHNERENLETLLAELRVALATLGPAEFIIVDDGSDDGSADFLMREAHGDPRLRPVILASRAGQSAAIAAGLARTSGDIIVTMDADLQNDPADIPKLVQALEGADVVSGTRTIRRDTWSRRVASRVANGIRRAVIGDPVTDIGCSLKAYRRAALDGLPMFEGVHRFLPALCVMRGATLREVGVNHRPRVHGRSHYGVARRAWRGLADLVGVHWLKARLIHYRVREVD